MDPINDELFYESEVELDTGLHSYSIIAVDMNNNKSQINAYIYSKNETTGIEDINIEPFQFKCYPNPVYKSLTISIFLNSSNNVTIDILNINGQNVANLFNQILPSGKIDIHWDKTNNSGQQVNSGLYFIRLKMGKSYYVKKIIVQ